MNISLDEKERRTILELAREARSELEELHNSKGICSLCKQDASLHYWPAGTCPYQSVWSSNKKRFVPSEKLVTEYDSIIEKLKAK